MDVQTLVREIGTGAAVVVVLAWLGRMLVDGLLARLDRQTTDTAAAIDKMASAVERLAERVEAGKCRAPGA